MSITTAVQWLIEHLFEQKGEGTLMVDIFNYTSPMGMLGKVADRWFLRKYMVNLLLLTLSLIDAIAKISPPAHLNINVDLT